MSDRKAKAKDHLQKVFSARNSLELAAHYDDWAGTYESDVVALGYSAPALLSGMVGRYVAPANSRILDAGAGTGIMGEILHSMGYEDLIAVDISRGMLEVAKKKGVYRELHQMTLGEPLDFPDDSFTAVVASGVFTLRHAPPDALDELIRITAPHGHILFSTRRIVYQQGGFKDKFEQLENEGKWKFREATKEFHSLPLHEDMESINRIFVYEVIA